MHRSLARYSAPVSFVQAPSWADFITAMVGFEVFGTHRPRPARNTTPVFLRADAPVGRFRRRLKMFAHILSSADSSKQRLRLAQIGGTMPLGETRRGRLQQGTRLCVPLLAFPQPRKAHCGTQFQRS